MKFADAIADTNGAAAVCGPPSNSWLFSTAGPAYLGANEPAAAQDSSANKRLPLVAFNPSSKQSSSKLALWNEGMKGRTVQ